MGDAVLERIKKSEKPNQFSDEWKELMITILKKTEVFRERKENCMLDANCHSSLLIIHERHNKAARDHLRKNKNEYFPIPSIVKLVEARKLIRKEKMEKLAEEKEKSFTAKSITQLEKSFLDLKAQSKTSLLEFEGRQKTVNVSTEKAKVFKCRTLGEFHHLDLSVKNINRCDLNKYFPARSYQSSRTRSAKDLKAISSTTDDKGCETSVSEREIIYEEYKDIDNKYLSRHINSALDENERKLNITQSVGDEVNPLISLLVQKNEIKSQNINLKPVQTNLEISESDFLEKLKRLKTIIQKFNLMHYWNAWKKFNSLRKMNKQKLERQNKISTFLKRLSDKKHEKCHLNCEKKDMEKKALPQVKPKMNRFSSEERKILVNHMHGNRNLHLEKIESDIIKSNEEAFENLKRQFKNYNPKLRPKVKILTMLSNCRKSKFDRADKKIRIKYPMPKVLLAVENRSRERRQRWENIVNRKKRLQEEKLKIEEDIAEKNKKMEEMLKRKQIEKFREKKRFEKEAAERRMIRLQRLVLAKNYYKTYLVRAMGFRPWKTLMRIRRDQLQAAIHHHQHVTLKCFWWNWRKYIEQQSNNRDEKGLEFHRKLLLKRSFQLWMMERDESRKKFQVAIDWADVKALENAFKIWLINVRTQRWNTIRREQLATSAFERKLKNRSFQSWRKLPKIIRNEKEKEMRKQFWRRKVQELLPDYQPMYSYEAA